jgi:hypothetical protein
MVNIFPVRLLLQVEQSPLELSFHLGLFNLKPRRLLQLIIDPSGQDLVYRDGWIERL